MGMDLGIAIGFIAAVAALAFVAGRRLALSVYQNKPLLFAECLIFSLVFAFGLSNRLSWAHAFPTPAALCWSNWVPVLLSFTAGLASEVSALRATWRRGVAGLMGVLAIGFLVLPVLRPQLFPIQVDQIAHWQDGVCMQSHEASCGPAAAATLLHQSAMLTPARLTYGGGQWATAPLPSAERLMADACLTSNQGTSSLGLVRGLRLAVAGSSHTVEVADQDPGMWVARGQLPNVAVVRFNDRRDRQPVRQLLGTDGEGHAVVVHSRTADGRWKIADPAVGWRYWSDEQFRQLFTGDAIYLTAGK
ncbi:cysteine peptidase family C39 domain-containing protein [Stieleria mannarensis]|uniref:cysteine peptidase family C39 domain-containing protein n=1 Tax=Stieleria mannarensis TaxID=2755585 RepID=UPI001600E231|nr:cysteine peptidase family C39 domain-containing protein [Rhodopirellula sp. JC639]